MKWIRIPRQQAFKEVTEEQQVVSRFATLQSKDARVRMNGLEEFLTFALGGRQEAFGESDTVLAERRMPIPLRRFYRFAGRWPSPYPERAPVFFETPEEGFFYSGIQGPGLATPDVLRESPEGRLAVYYEQSGNWTGFTDAEGDDPVVWLSGYVGSDHIETSTPTGETLSGWLVTHCLVALAWELGNHLCSGTALSRIGAATQRKGETGLTEWYNREAAHAHLLWEAKENPCAELRGSFHLFRNSILVHDCGNTLRFAALTSSAATEMRQHALRPQDLD
jgi:hypothetical protein